MKITFVNYIDGEARILVDGFPKTTFVFKLKKNMTKQDLIDYLNDEVDKLEPDDMEQLFIDLDLKSIEGTELGGK